MATTYDELSLRPPEPDTPPPLLMSGGRVPERPGLCLRLGGRPPSPTICGVGESHSASTVLVIVARAAPGADPTGGL